MTTDSSWLYKITLIFIKWAKNQENILQILKIIQWVIIDTPGYQMV